MKLGRQSKIYLLLFSAITFLFIANSYIFFYQLKIQKEYGHLINISGRQRMLSQRMTKYSLLLLQEEQDLFKNSLDSLQVNLNEFKKNMTELKAFNNSNEIRLKFTDITPFYNKLTNELITISRNKTATKNEIKVILETEPLFLSRMNAIVFQYVEDLEKRIDVFKYSIILVNIFFFTIIVLKIIPMFMQNERYKANLLIKNDELNKIVVTKDKFFAIIAHDLKGPIASLNTVLDYLTIDLTTKSYEEIQRYLDMVKQLNFNTYKLLENLLTWARSQRNEISFKPEMNSLTTVVLNNIRLFNEKMERKNLSVEFDANRVVIGEFDYEMINTVVRNLLSNAMKYSNDHGKIIISLKNDNEFISCSIKDRGIGIPENLMHTLFLIDNGKFSRDGTRGETGTGLGLVLCKEFICRHEGTIEAFSEPGKGSEFIFKIPAKQNNTEEHFWTRKKDKETVRI